MVNLYKKNSGRITLFLLYLIEIHVQYLTFKKLSKIDSHSFKHKLDTFFPISLQFVTPNIQHTFFFATQFFSSPRLVRTELCMFSQHLLLLQSKDQRQFSLLFQQLPLYPKLWLYSEMFPSSKHSSLLCSMQKRWLYV